MGTNPAKRYLFTLAERHELARRCLGHLGNVQVVAFSGLLVDYAYEHKIPVVIRGVRNPDDFNYEVLLHQIGDSQRLGVDTFLLPARSHLCHVSSGAVKALQKEQGLVHPYVPLLVKQALEAKVSGQYLVGITGEIGVGKSRLSRHLCALGQARGLQVHDLDLDRIGHEILEVHRAPVYEDPARCLPACAFDPAPARKRSRRGRQARPPPRPRGDKGASPGAHRRRPHRRSRHPHRVRLPFL